MKCWKCGQEATLGASACPKCSAAQKRTAPASEAGRAMRSLYDDLGRDGVLEIPSALVNGLGDLLENSQMLRGQLRIAMDAGIGRMYLDQLNAKGRPDAAFDGRIKAAITNAGLSDGAAQKLMDCFDEMIGWRVAETSHSGFRMVIEDHFPIAGRGEVITGFLQGTVRNAMTCRITFADGRYISAVVAGLERYHKLYDQLSSGDDPYFGVGILLMLKNVERGSLKGGVASGE